MQIVLPAIYRSALPSTQTLLKSLRRSGVIRATGCLVTSAGVGVPPEGHDRIATNLQAGCKPLEDSRIRSIRAAVAAEVATTVLEFYPSECSDVGVVQTSFIVNPASGVQLTIETCGLIDHEARVFLN